MTEFDSEKMWPVLNQADEETREVYARYGLAMFTAQILEHGMVNSVVALTILQQMHTYPDRAAWEQAVDDRYENEFAKTFGNIIRALEKLPEVPREMVTRLLTGKKVRDELAHRFFRERSDDLMHGRGRQKMIEWCDEQIALFGMLDGELSKIVEPAMERQGVTAEWLAERVAEDLARLGYESGEI